MPVTPYSKTSLPAEVNPSVPANLPNADIESHYNKPLRGIEELWACINGANAGNDANGNPLQDYTSIGITDRLEALEMVGQVKSYYGSSAPAKHAFIYGQAISRTTYAAAFAVLGTTFGAGDGVNTFNLPDERGRISLGKDDMGGSAANRVTSASTGGANSTTLGGVGGEQTHTLVVSESAAHAHTATTGGSATVGSGANGSFATTGATVAPVGNVTMSALNTGTVGGDGAHNNMPPWLAANRIMYLGV